MTDKQKDIVDGLFRETGSAILQLVYRFTGDRQLAEDVAQQTYFLACLKIEPLRAHPNPKGWLFTTARYLMMRELSGAQYSRRVDMEGFEELLSAREDDKSMAEMLPRGLGEEERALLLEHLERGFSMEEMAEKRGITLDACRRRYARARSKCRELMLKEREELEKI